MFKEGLLAAFAMIVTQAAGLCAVSWSNCASNVETNSTKTRAYPRCTC
jgi:hypothetical protein